MNLQSNNRHRRKKVGEHYYGVRHCRTPLPVANIGRDIVNPCYVQLYTVSVYVALRNRFLRIQTSLIDKGNQKHSLVYLSELK